MRNSLQKPSEAAKEFQLKFQIKIAKTDITKERHQVAHFLRSVDVKFFLKLSEEYTAGNKKMSLVSMMNRQVQLEDIEKSLQARVDKKMIQDHVSVKCGV